METISTHQEILLVTGTSFTSREFCETTDGINSNHLTEKEKLIMACWNGLLPEILPEVFEQPSANNKLYLWKVREASSFIELELGDINSALENEFSIDPYSFMRFQSLS
jgi:hypothetical protein